MKREYSWRVGLWTVLAVFIVLKPYAVSFGDDGANFTLVNATPLFLHAVINDESITYIPPGVAITRQTNSSYSVTAEVAYSPGQGKTGSAFRTFQTSVHVTQSESTSTSQSNDCSNSNDNTCQSSTSSNSGGSTTTTIDPITWVVTADTLLSH